VSRLPPALARRIDRLARRAHAFHRWAHHPLCTYYAAEVVRVGHRTRVCLGCSLTAVGAIAGVMVGLVVPSVPGVALLGIGAVLFALVPMIVVRPSTPPALSVGANGAGVEGLRANGFHPAWRSRARKLLTRFLPTAAAGFPVAQAALAPSPSRIAAAALAATAVAWVILRYRRRGPDRSACDACPEGPPGSRCPGLAPIARRERALSRLAGRWIATALPIPGAGAGPAATCPPPRPPPAAPPASSPRKPRP